MNIAVYCSARTDITRECFDDAAKLGNWMGKNGHSLVYGGLKMGLMDAVATATHNAGGKITGAIPEHRSHLQHPDNTVNIHVTSLHERKQVMEEIADVFVALDGGYGTIDEVMSALASMSFFNNPKPLFLLNRNNLYTPLAQMFAEMVTRGLMYPEVSNRLILCPNVDDLINRLQNIAEKHDK